MLSPSLFAPVILTYVSFRKESPNIYRVLNISRLFLVFKSGR